MDNSKAGNDAERRAIRLSPEYSADWPLWETGSDKYNLEPGDLGLSRVLTAQLRQWTDFWEKHFHYDRGWDSERNRNLWAQWGDEVGESLRAEIANFADLRVEFEWTL